MRGQFCRTSLQCQPDCDGQTVIALNDTDSSCEAKYLPHTPSSLFTAHPSTCLSHVRHFLHRCATVVHKLAVPAEFLEKKLLYSYMACPILVWAYIVKMLYFILRIYWPVKLGASTLLQFTHSGGYVYEQPSRIYCSTWLDVSHRSWDGIWLNRSAREIKRFKQSWRLDSALYKNVPLPFK